MQHLSVSFRPESTPCERDAALEKIRRMPEVRQADFLKRDATNAEIRRMAVVALPDDAAGDVLAAQIATLPAVESAEGAARRRPLGG